MTTPPDSPDTALPIIAIVGRPNVGKSALFNRIVGRRVAIVHEESGVTRDRIAANADFDGRHFMVVDTGGLGSYSDESKVGLFDGLIRQQVEAVLAEATKLILVVDAQVGITPLDAEIAKFLHRRGHDVIVAANKADNDNFAEEATTAFARLGFEAVVPVTCTHGIGLDDLLETVLKDLPVVGEPPPRATPLKIAVVGRPNVGKSSLVNCLLGQDRVMVSEIAGTTRDAIDVPCVFAAGTRSLPSLLIDTAGLRAKSKVDTLVEVFSVMRAQNAIRRADLVLFVIDAAMLPTAQDRKIAHLIGAAHKCCLIVANKWDLVPRGTTHREFETNLRREMPFMEYAPVLPVSALQRQQLPELHERVLDLHEKMQAKLPTSLINQVLQDLAARTPPPAIGGRMFKLFYATTTHMAPPHVVLFVNHRELGTPAYVQYLESHLRETFYPEGGIPVHITLRDRPKSGDEGARAGRYEARDATPSYIRKPRPHGRRP